MNRAVVLCDLDGVVWRGADPIPGAAATLSELSASGFDVWFVTNNSNRPVGHYEQRLDDLGLAAEGRVATSALAAAALVDGTDDTLVCAGPGVIEALEARGHRWVGAEVHPDDVTVPILIPLIRTSDPARTPSIRSNFARISYPSTVPISALL